MASGLGMLRLANVRSEAEYNVCREYGTLLVGENLFRVIMEHLSTQGKRAKTTQS